MKFLGIDYGAKRVGLAISSDDGKLAFPKEIIPNDKNMMGEIGKILKDENITEIVVGESLNFSGAPNAIMKQVELFIGEMQKIFKVPIHKQKEFLTSVEARKTKNGGKRVNLSQAHSKLKNKRENKVDASAAALILQRYLDQKNKQQ